MGNCCTECFADEYVKEFVRGQDHLGDCEYCGSSNVHIASTAEVGYFVREGIDRAYEPGDSGLVGSDVVDVLHEHELPSERSYSQGSEIDLLRDLISDGGPSPHDMEDGEWDKFQGGDAVLLELPGGERPYAYSWRQFTRHVKHFARFFDSGKEDSNREQLLRPIRDLMCEELVVQLEAGAEFWRARVSDADLPKDKTDQCAGMGPPPASKATNNRMSPAGISYFYLGSDINLCLSEIRPYTGDTIWVAKFQLKRAVAIIDLMESLREPESIFDPQYDPIRAEVPRFLHAFRDDISRPLRPEATPLEYIPTQVLSEYIRTLGYHGIRFPSSQCSKRYPEKRFNLTCFMGPEREKSGRSATVSELPSFTDYFQIVEAYSIRISNVDFGHHRWLSC